MLSFVVLGFAAGDVFVVDCGFVEGAKSSRLI